MSSSTSALGTRHSALGTRHSALGKNCSVRFAALAVMLSAFAVLPLARGQCDPTWVQASTTGPGNRSGYALTYDSDRHVTVLFGGSNGTTLLNDLWEWDGTTWTLIPTVGTPSARSSSTMVYDSVEHLMLLSCGNLSETVSTPQTYSYNPLTREWVLRASTPPCNQARSGHGMAYDAERNQIVLFGGYATGSSPSNHTSVWNWATSSWVQCDLFTPPPPRGGMGMCYDSHRQRVVMFGGQAGGGCPSTTFNDTWEWNGSLWTLQSVGTAPAPRSFFGMAYDPRSRRSVIFGGRNYNNSGCNVYPGDTWAWSGTEWTDLNASEPEALTSISMVYDTARGNMVFYGGATQFTAHSDTWTLRYCPADFNCSGGVNSQDYFDFIACFFGSPCPPGRSADFNHDGNPNSQDFFDFLAAFFVGC